MALIDGPVPIETDPHILRARRTAALTRVGMGLLGMVLLLSQPGLGDRPALGAVGFAIILISSAVQFAAPRLALLSVEESLAAVAGVLIVGLGSQHVGVLHLLWLVAVASGVLARGGRAHWVGRNILLVSLALPILRSTSIDSDYGAFCVATISLLLTSGRLTRELNLLLRQARLEADSAETLLLAGDIAARMADRDGHPSVSHGGAEQSAGSLSSEERTSATAVLSRLVGGEGLTMFVQPIVDIRSGVVHAFEALARFGEPVVNTTPLHWFALAEEIGGRPALERACLREALELLGHRPPDTRLTVNLSAPVLLEEESLSMLAEAGDRQQDDLRGLVIEITEETLIGSDEQLQAAFEPLRARGAKLAVDDMGAGYSGLRQITTVRPSYLKLDRSLCTGIDSDPERAALVGALSGYAAQVGSLLIAEGIETTAELEALRSLGVPLVQGFRLSRPGAPWPQADAEAARGPDLQAAGVLDPSEWLDGEAPRLRRGRHSRPLSPSETDPSRSPVDVVGSSRQCCCLTMSSVPATRSFCSTLPSPTAGFGPSTSRLWPLLAFARSPSTWPASEMPSRRLESRTGRGEMFSSRWTSSESSAHTWSATHSAAWWRSVWPRSRPSGCYRWRWSRARRPASSPRSVCVPLPRRMRRHSRTTISTARYGRPSMRGCFPRVPLSCADG